MIKHGTHRRCVSDSLSLSALAQETGPAHKTDGTSLEKVLPRQKEKDPQSQQAANASEFETKLFLI